MYRIGFKKVGIDTFEPIIYERLPDYFKDFVTQKRNEK